MSAQLSVGIRRQIMDMRVNILPALREVVENIQQNRHVDLSGELEVSQAIGDRYLHKFRYIKNHISPHQNL